jgi:hypothetical protein
MSDLDCRVAKLEQRIDGLCRELTEDKYEASQIMKEIFLKLNSILEAQNKQKGFWSGVVFVISGIVSLVGVGVAIATGKFN